MGLFDFLKPRTAPAPAPQPIKPTPPDVQIHNAPIVPSNINAIKQDCFVLHFETTGIFAPGDPNSKYTNQITAIKCIRVKDCQVFNTLFTYVNPCRSIPDDATKASGINAQTVAGAPTIDQVFPTFCDFIQDAITDHTLILCYNAEFNGDFLKTTMRRFFAPGDFRLFDVMKLADKKLRMSDYPTLKQAMKVMKIKDRELNTDIHKCTAIYNLALALVDVPDNSVEV